MRARRAAGVLVTLAFAVAPFAQTGFTPLFDGATLQGWRLVDGKGTGYRVEEGALVCGRDGGGRLFTEREYSDFVLRFEYRMEPGANSGIAIRAPLEGNPAYAAMEIQIRDDPHPVYARTQIPVRFHGSIYDVIAASPSSRNPPSVWNQEEITAKGPRITVTLNGAAILDADLRDVKDTSVLERHPGLLRPRGHIGLLGHAGAGIAFRKIEVRELVR